MADPTQLDRIEQALAAHAVILRRLDLQNQQHTALLNALNIGEQLMSAEMDQLVAAVEVNTTVDQSVLTYITGIAQQITDAAGDRTKSLALAATIKASTDAVTAALTANTPVATP